MICHAFTMGRHSSRPAKYRELHDEIWPEMTAMIERSGVTSTTIFKVNPVLFLHSELHDPSAWNKRWGSPAHDRSSEDVIGLLRRFRENAFVGAGGPRKAIHLETKR